LEKTYRIQPEQWSDALYTHFPALDKEELLLVVIEEEETYSLSITNPLLIAVCCLDDCSVIHADVLGKALFTDETYDPLRQETGQYLKSGLKPGEITLLSYFYLNLLPFSTSLITRWFIDIGAPLKRATDLANAVYIARVNKEEADPWFLSDSVSRAIPGDIISKELRNMVHPVKPVEVFDILHKYQKLRFTYDYSGINPGYPKVKSTVINLNKIDETGFLIEDHAFIIAGLSVKITEFSKLTEDKWPLFTEAMLGAIPIYLRDFYALGRLIAEKPEIFHTLIDEYQCTISIVSIDEDGSRKSAGIDKQRLSTMTLTKNSGIPVFLNIRK